MQSPPFPRYLVRPRSKYSPQHHVLKHPQLPFLPPCQRPSVTPIQNNRQNCSSIYKTTDKIIVLYISCINSRSHSATDSVHHRRTNFDSNSGPDGVKTGDTYWRTVSGWRWLNHPGKCLQRCMMQGVGVEGVQVIITAERRPRLAGAEIRAQIGRCIRYNRTTSTEGTCLKSV